MIGLRAAIARQVRGLLSDPANPPIERAFDAMRDFYGWSLNKAMTHHRITMAISVLLLFATVHLFRIMPMGFIPSQDIDQLNGQKWVTPTIATDEFVATPVVVSDNVIIASRAGRLWRINIPNGQWDWKDRKTNGPVVAGLSSDGGAVYVPALDQRVYAFGAQDGFT